MFCPKCGQEINDDAQVCVHCGRSVGNEASDPKYSQPKTGIGVIAGLFLGLLGLLFLLAYPEGTVARKTFLKAWMITFFVCLGISIVLYIIILVAGAAAFGSVASQYY